MFLCGYYPTKNFEIGIIGPEDGSKLNDIVIKIGDDRVDCIQK